MWLCGCSAAPLPFGMADAGVDAAPAIDLAMPPDLAPPPLVKTRFLDGTNLMLAGVTADDWVAYYNGNFGNALNVAPIGGGAPQPIAKNAFAAISGRVIFAFANYDAMTYSAELYAWSSTSNGAQLISSKSSYLAYAATRDGKSILYLDNYDPMNARADVVIASLDKSFSRTVFAQVDTRMCPPGAVGAGDRFVVAHCPAGMTTAGVDTVDEGGNVTSLQPKAFDYVTIDAAGDRVLFVDALGTAIVADPDGKNAAKFGGNISYCFLSVDGAGADCQTFNGGIVKGLPASGQTVPFVNQGVAGMWGASPNADAALYYTQFDMMTGHADFRLASAAGARTLLADATGCTYGDLFTVDGLHALFLADCNQSYVGKLNAADTLVDQTKAISTSTWVAWGAHDPLVAYNDNYAQAGLGNGRADLLVADLSSSDPPRTVEKAAEVDFFLTRDRARAVYSFQAVAGAEGLYVVTLP